MKKENTKSPKKGNPVDAEDRWIDVHDDDVMRAHGLWRPYPQTPRDPSVWTKTPYERRMLKKLRHTCKEGTTRFSTAPSKIIRLYGKLIINLVKNNRFSKTTYSTECWQHEIPEVLAKYQYTNKKTGYTTSAVRKYVWNGRTYGPQDLPFAW